MKTNWLLTLWLILFLNGFSCAQKLQSLIDEALVNNPRIKQLELSYKRAFEKVNEVNTLPNTNLGAGYFVSEPETRTGPQRFKISVKQMMPWFGTIRSRENYVRSMAETKFEDISIAKRKLVLSISQSYYNLQSINNKQKIINENIDLLQAYEKLVLTAIEVDKASVVDLLKLQIRQNELKEKIQVLEQRYLIEQTATNKLLNRDDSKPITPSDPFEYSSFSMSNSEANLNIHPELIKLDKLYASVEKSEELNQKESNPSIGLGLDYINVDERPDMSFDDNGKDIIMPMLSVSIPLFNKKHNSKTIQNQLEQEEIINKKQNQLNLLDTKLESAKRLKKVAELQYELQSKNLEQAKNAEQILIKSYETAKVDFNDILEIQELQLKFQLKMIEAIKAQLIQQSILNYLTVNNN